MTELVGRAKKQWAPLAGLLISACAVIFSVAYAWATRASSTDMNDAKASIRSIETSVEALKKTLDDAKAELKTHTNAVLANTNRQFDKHDESIKGVSSKLAEIDKQLTAIHVTVENLKDRLGKK